MSILDIIPGGSYLQDAAASAANKAGFAKARITGTIDKALYSAQGVFYDAVGSTAKTAKTVTTGIRNYSLYAVLAGIFIILWPFIAPLLANAFSSLLKRGKS